MSESVSALLAGVEPVRLGATRYDSVRLGFAKSKQEARGGGREGDRPADQEEARRKRWQDTKREREREREREEKGPLLREKGL